MGVATPRKGQGKQVEWCCQGALAGMPNAIKGFEIGFEELQLQLTFRRLYSVKEA
jgi:hypothetical protein